ncbi:MAG TPA: Rrf2 family transcriptional regulator [Caldithrix abyssi]|uniref:Rrf2 family transcriptional regulator n=1 Tax=Caldithrix abyssi TaxID=187145 RepID=A0A7V1LXV9_CALAY|nr:Rrf2 family transcriptional regulator [Caldithrix abyssi]
MLLSKSCVYGIRAVLYLSVNDEREYVPIKEISDKMGISFHFLTKILQVLTNAGMIKSMKGAKGGVGLNQKASSISLYDVIRELDGETLFEECVLGLPGCADDNPCSMHKIWRVTKAELKKELEEENFGSLAKQITEDEIRLYDI